MGEVRPDLAEMAGKFTVSKHSANLFHNIHPVNVNRPESMQKDGRKNLDLS